MRRVFGIAALAVGLLASAVSPALAFRDGVMSPAEVIAIDRDRDGSVITVEGEAVGEHLRAAGGGRWVNILGDEVGLGIWVTEEMAESIEYFGDYRYDGDIVRVTGVVNVACEQHGGEFDVHAQKLEIISRGGPRPVEVRPVKGIVGAVGLVLAFGLWRLYIHRRERRML